ncbi:MAG TPA: RNA methyltransferase [Chthonomonadaceae bacterium]|nr:RNA methyltransferase [Chthonomonadaceae bacterium]
MTPIENRPKFISSRNDLRIKRRRDLQRREERDRTRLYFIDGIRFLFQATQMQVPLETLLYAPKLLTNPVGQKLVRQQRRIGTPCLEVPPKVYHSVSLAEEPQGVGAVVRQRWEKLETIRPASELCWAAVERAQSPGNLGTIIRTSEAVGGAGLILLDEATDPYDPATVRATMGATFSQRFVRAPLTELAEWKQRYRCFLAGTSPSAATDYHAISYPPPTVLFMGGERQGLSPQCQALCDVIVKIPMVGACDSLNLAVATSVMLYELFNQHRAARSQGHN